MPQGTFVHLAIGAANRDPTQFPDPDRIDIRRHPNRHLAFGLGIHVPECRSHAWKHRSRSANWCNVSDGLSVRALSCVADAPASGVFFSIRFFWDSDTKHHGGLKRECHGEPAGLPAVPTWQSSPLPACFLGGRLERSNTRPGRCVGLLAIPPAVARTFWRGCSLPLCLLNSVSRWSSKTDPALRRTWQQRRRRDPNPMAILYSRPASRRSCTTQRYTKSSHLTRSLTSAPSA